MDLGQAVELDQVGELGQPELGQVALAALRELVRLDAQASAAAAVAYSMPVLRHDNNALPARSQPVAQERYARNSRGHDCRC